MAINSEQKSTNKWPVITLTTDSGLEDYYVSAIKGAIISQLPEVHIIDISHNIPTFDISQAAFVLKNVIAEFPKGTVHIIGILPDATAESPHIAVSYENQYFIAADNGIFSLLFTHKPDKIVELTIKQDTDFLTFPTKDIFVKAACHLARGGVLEVLGGPRDSFLERTNLQPITDKNIIRGNIVYIDHYGNLITNIKKDLFNKIGKGRRFNILMKDESSVLNKISNCYNDVEFSRLLVLFVAAGNLGIALNSNGDAKLLIMRVGNAISSEFYDKKNR